MSRSEEAIKKANDVLGLLSKIDDVLLENSKTRMAATLERVLTNNQPSTKGFVTNVDWEKAPQSAKDRFQGPTRPSNVTVLEIHAPECYEKNVPMGECDLHHVTLGYDKKPVLHDCRTCTTKRIESPLTARWSGCVKTGPYEALLRYEINQGKLDMSQFPPGVDSIPYMVNFIHPDLKDLYEEES